MQHRPPQSNFRGGRVPRGIYACGTEVTPSVKSWSQDVGRYDTRVMNRPQKHERYTSLHTFYELRSYLRVDHSKFTARSRELPEARDHET